MTRPSRQTELVSPQGRGRAVIIDSIAVIRLRDRPGFPVGVQDRFRSGGVDQVWPVSEKGRRRAAEPPAISNLPIVESI